MFRYFFTYIDNIPRKFHSTLFSVQHLLTMGMIVCLWGILTIIFKDKGEEKKWRMLILVSLLLPLLEGLQVLWYKAVGQFSWGYTLPLHLCSLMCIILPVMTITKNRLLMEYSYAMGLAPALLTLVTPDVYYYPAFSFIYFQTMLVHGIICFIPIFMVFGMGFRPDIHKLPKVIGMLIGFALLVTPVNFITNGNYFFLRLPAPGSPMELFAHAVGSPWYLVPTFLLGCVLWLILYAPFAAVKRYQRHTENPAETEKVLVGK
ncbi:MAG TPA: TIGR02206 family membrane protein [Ruminiclostridium sp.]|nr:TIGR02206 family membrane protein [Ruminiclostridium sp.]